MLYDLVVYIRLGKKYSLHLEGSTVSQKTPEKLEENSINL
jgi:hypothetical protein